MPDFNREFIQKNITWVDSNTEIANTAMGWSGTDVIGDSSYLGYIRWPHRIIFFAGLLIVPRLDSVTPDDGEEGSADTVIVMTGRFNADDTAYWNGLPLVTVFLDGETIQATVPEAYLVGPGSGAISVANIGGAWSNSLAFSVTEEFSYGFQS